MQKKPKIFSGPLVALGAIFLLGAALVIWPEAVVSIFSPLMGLVLVGAGALTLGHSLVLWKRLARPYGRLLQGLVNLAAGIIFLIKNDVSMAFLVVLFGLYILAMAVLDFAAVWAAKKAGKRWADTLGDGIFKLVLGVLLFFGPFSGRSLWLRMLGIYFVVVAGNTLQWLLRESKTQQPPPRQNTPEGPH
ncbi:MAG: HdeD family acid-resistance protein [Oscillospiraceae bacterium]